MASTMRFDTWENPTATKSVTMDKIAGGSGSIPLPVSPTSVTVAGGTGSVNSMGVVSFTNATSITIDGFITKPNTIYRIAIQNTGSTNNANFVRFVKNGSAITSGYYGASTYVSYNVSLVTDQQKNNGTFACAGYTGLYGAVTEILLKTNSSGSMYEFISYGLDRANYSPGGYSNASTGDITGIYLFTDTGTNSGIIQIFEDRSI